MTITAQNLVPATAFRQLLGSPDLGDRRPVYRTYDHQVQNNTVILPGGDAAMLRVKGTRRAIAVSTDGNGRYCHLDPRAGAAIAVAEAARNIVATGARPAAITDCLNFGNPEKPEVFWELKESVEGMAEACRGLELPVVSGNVSLYNDTSGVSVYPTPVVGMVGLLEDVDKRCPAGFSDSGDMMLQLGDTRDEFGGSELIKVCQDRVVGRPPRLDLEVERRAHRLVLEMIDQELLRSAHDLSDGGLAIAVAEACLLGDIGATCDSIPGAELGPNVALFSESQSRFLVSCRPDSLNRVQDLARRHEVPCHVLGRVGDRVTLGDYVNEPLQTARAVWEGALGRE